MRRRIFAMFCDNFDNRGADDNAIGDACDIGGLLWRADTKADGDGQVGSGFQAGDGFFDAGLCGLLLAGDAGDADIVEEAAGVVQYRRASAPHRWSAWRGG